MQVDHCRVFNDCTATHNHDVEKANKSDLQQAIGQRDLLKLAPGEIRGPPRGCDSTNDTRGPVIKGPGASNGPCFARWPSNDSEHESRSDKPPPQSEVLALGKVGSGGVDDVDREDSNGMQSEKSFDMKLDITVATPPGEKVEDNWR